MTYSVKDLEERLGVGEHTILGWIKSGELKAINVGRVAGKRPKWRISPEALAAFELGRESGGPPVATKTKRKKADPEVITYY
jgi:excisionase family DNA binding protein